MPRKQNYKFGNTWNSSPLTQETAKILSMIIPARNIFFDNNKIMARTWQSYHDGSRSILLQYETELRTIVTIKNLEMRQRTHFHCSNPL